MGGPAPNYSTEGYGTPIGRVEIYYIINSSCLSPSGIMSSNVLSTSATLGWTGVSGTQRYDYIVSTSPTNPTHTVPFQTTTSTSINATGLTLSTNYFLYLRNKCSSSSYSPWVQYSFWTLPPCDPPSNVKLTNLTPTSVTISWDTVSSATSYDYIVNNDPSSPVSATGWTTVNAPPVLLTGLVENTKYYVHLRSNCPVGEVSNWILDSFMTPVPCREPELQMANIGVNEAVVYWDPVPTVLWYEYDVSRHASPPGLGTKYQFTSLHMSALNPGANCYMHVRSFCTSNGTESYSPWETISFKTWQVGVDNLQSESSGIRVYPSPVTDQATIEIHGRVPQDARIELADLTGRILQRIPVQSSRQVISMAGLSSGWYWIQYSGDGIKENRRILKR